MNSLLERLQSQTNHIKDVKNTLRSSIVSKGVQLVENPSFEELNSGILGIKPYIPELVYTPSPYIINVPGENYWTYEIILYNNTSKITTLYPTTTTPNNIIATLNSYILNKRVAILTRISGSTMRQQSTDIHINVPSGYWFSIIAAGGMVYTSFNSRVMDVTASVSYDNSNISIPGNRIDIV